MGLPNPKTRTSQYNPVIDTNISFYESDRGTGVLNFAVTKN
ncbi:hypothetical protein W222_02541, partial [Staphylococcus aureus DAR1276]